MSKVDEPEFGLESPLLRLEVAQRREAFGAKQLVLLALAPGARARTGTRASRGHRQLGRHAFVGGDHGQHDGRGGLQ